MMRSNCMPSFNYRATGTDISGEHCICDEAQDSVELESRDGHENACVQNMQGAASREGKIN